MSQPNQQSLLKHECGHSKNGRNLVLCIDGTSNQFGAKNTNVVELHNIILKEVADNQQAWYHPGIGTYARPSRKSLKYCRQVLDNKIDLAVAWNFESTVHEAYEWLADNYKDGDCIFLFGFSRGAYQVRVLAGMIDKVGLLYKGNKNQIKFAYEIYEDLKSDLVETTQRGAEEISRAEHFKRGFSHRNVKVHFVGAWDTVSSIGIVRGKQMLPRTVDGMKHVCYFRQALALDERRVKFLPEYAYGGDTIKHYQANEPQSSNESLVKDYSSRSSTPTSKSSCDILNSQTKEVWFAGTHSDIGGGNVDNAAMDRGRPALRWMASEATEAGLRIEKFKRELSLKEQVEIIESLTLPWQPLEFMPLKRLTFTDEEDGKTTTHKPHLGESRKIKCGQKIHSSVLLADTAIKYTPKAKPPSNLNPETFWNCLREGREAFEEWVEVDMEGFMRHLVKSALAEHHNPKLEDLLLAASTRGRQGLYRTVIDSLGNPDLVPDLHVKNQLLRSLMDILRNTSSLDELQLIPSINVSPLVSDLLTSNDQDQISTAEEFVNEFTDPCLRVIHEQYWVQSVTYSPDGKWIASAPEHPHHSPLPKNHTVRIWDAESGKLVLQPFEGHKDAIFSVAISPDSKLLASGSNDKTIRIWNIEAKIPAMRVIEAHESSVESIKFSSDGRYIVSGSEDRTVKLWDTATGGLARGPFLGHTAQVTSVAFSPDGMSLASSSVDTTVRIWDIATGKSTKLVHPDIVWSVAFSPDSKHIVSGSVDGIVRVWNAKTGKALCKSEGHKDRVPSVEFSPNGKYIAFASYDKTVWILEAETGKLARPPLKGHSDRLLTLAFSADGNCIISGGKDNTIRIWDVATLMS